jgi:hypothetical protein
MADPKYFYTHLITDEEAEKAKRSQVWPFILLFHSFSEKVPLRCGHFRSLTSGDYAYMVTNDGLCPLRICVSRSSSGYVIQTATDPRDPHATNWTNLAESTNLRYIMRRFSGAKPNSSMTSLNHTLGHASRQIFNNVSYGVGSLAGRYRPTKTPSDYRLDTLAQEWAVRLAVGGAQKIAVPEPVLASISALWEYYDKRDGVYEKYMSKMSSFLGGEKYVIGYMKDRHDNERWTVGARDFTPTLEYIRNYKDLPESSMPVTVPFRTFGSIDDADRWIAQETGRGIKGTLTMLKVSRGDGYVNSDSAGYIPCEKEFRAFKDTGSFTWRMNASGVYTYFVFDR